MVWKAHVRMISCAWGRRLAGKCCANLAGSSVQRPIICGEQDEVAQVSITSVSGSNSLPPHSHGSGGELIRGSTGNCSKAASFSLPQALHVQAGKGTPK